MGLHTLGPDITKCNMGSIDVNGALDPLRKKVINAMLHGTNLGIDMGKSIIDFKGKFNEGPTNWKSETVFNFAEFRKKDNYRAILMDEDLVDNLGNKK